MQFDYRFTVNASKFRELNVSNYLVGKNTPAIELKNTNILTYGLPEE